MTTKDKFDDSEVKDITRKRADFILSSLNNQTFKIQDVVFEVYYVNKGKNKLSLRIVNKIL